MLENRCKGGAFDIHLAESIEIGIGRAANSRQLTGSRAAIAGAPRQILAADIPEEPQPKFYES